MDTAAYQPIAPARKPFKRALNKTVLFVLGRSLQSLSRRDPLIKHEVAGWPHDFTLMLRIRPDGGAMAVTRTATGHLRYLGANYDESKADVVIYLKSIETAFAMLTGQLGIDVAYAQHGMCARGDLSYTVSVVRVLNITEAYLFPAFMSHRLMKRLPPIPGFRKHYLRIRTYLLGIAFGK